MTARLFAVLTSSIVAATGMVVAAPSASAAGDYDVTVTLSPSSPHVDDNIVVSGVVTEAGTSNAVSGASVTIMRTDPSVSAAALPPTVTGSDGTYSVTDQMPAVRGTVTYAVQAAMATFSGDGSASTYVHRIPTSLTIAAGRSIKLYGHGVKLTAHLGTTFTNRAVTITARPYDGDPRVIASGDVDATSGDKSATYTMRRRTRFTARFSGDDKYAPAAVYVVVRARAVLTERLRGYYASSNGYRIYHPGDSPELDARLWPHLHRVCLYFRAQYRSGGKWHNASLSPCVRTDGEARAAALLNNALSLPYRLRAEWRGNVLALANHGPWMHLRFH